MAGRSPTDPPLELEAWVEAEDFAQAVYELAVLSQLEPNGPRFRLDDGRWAEIRLEPLPIEGLPELSLLEHLEGLDLIRSLRAGKVSDEVVGLFSRVRIGLVDGAGWDA